MSNYYSIASTSPGQYGHYSPEPDALANLKKKLTNDPGARTQYGTDMTEMLQKLSAEPNTPARQSQVREAIREMKYLKKEMKTVDDPQFHATLNKNLQSAFDLGDDFGSQDDYDEPGF